MNIETKAKLVLAAVLLALVAVISCYDTTNPPPCPPGEQWPSPCAAAPRDAGEG